MKQEEYIKSVVRKLQCSGQKKAEIERELISDIQTALGDGESWEEIEGRMGTPDQLAEEFNENLTPEELAGRKRKQGFLIAGIIIGILVLLGTGAFWMLPKSYELEKSGIFQEAVVLERTEEIIALLDMEDYAALGNYADEKMQPLIQGNSIAEAKSILGEELGENQGITSSYMAEVRQSGKRYAMIQATVQYENQSVTYTISYDEDMKLAGLYMK